MAGIGRVTGLNEFALELDAATSRMLPEVVAVTSKGCLNIKKSWQQSWKGIKHAKVLPYSISYDVTVLPGKVVGDVGPEDTAKKQGFLGGIIEFGGIHNAPRPGGAPALDAEAPRFEAAMLALTAKLLP